MKRLLVSLAFLCAWCVSPAFATDPPETQNDERHATLAETSRLSEDLIYSVNRSPERLFDTARAVEVITADEIARRSGRGLADILAETAGIYVRRGLASGGAAIVRGLAANQVLVLVDGVKLTNGTWGSEDGEYLNLVDVAQIDRVEIVRGVVSVLGTESLGGIINIIMKKGPPSAESLSGSVGLRYGTADDSFKMPVTVAGQNGRLRFVAGFTLANHGDVRAGGDAGTQDVSAFRTRSGYGSAQFLLTPEKTFSAMYSDVQQRGVHSFAPGLIGPIEFKPTRTRVASVSYLDLTSHSWRDSLRATAYWNRQTKGVDLIVDVPRLDLTADNGDTLYGGGLEGGKFLGRAHPHQLVYGVDVSSETTESRNVYLDEGTGQITHSRADTIPGSRYQTLGVYLQDRFDIGSRLTASLGARYGVFSLKASENGDLGAIDIDTRKSDYAGSVNLVYHATPSVNLIANAIRGFRTPNIYDATGEIWGNNTLLVPTTNLSTEHVVSYELGAKYQSARFSGSAFLFRNSLDDLLVITAGTLNGLPFYDTNGNRTRDPWERIVILQNRNSGAGTIDGIEMEGALHLRDAWMLRANYTRTKGTNTASDEPFPGIPPAFGSAALRFAPAAAYAPWGEVLLSFAASQHRLAQTELADPLFAEGTPSAQVWSLRGGATLSARYAFTVELENVFDKQYRTHDSRVYEPGRQLIVSTQYRF